MYRIIKVLNNNGILVYHNETGRELILLGNGVGFGKRPTQQIEQIQGARVYSLVTRQKQQSVLKVVNGIRPEFIEAAGRIIDEAEKVFPKMNRDILLPMADHIALAAKRAKENRQMPNPFTPDIRVLFAKEFSVAQKGREIPTDFEIDSYKYGSREPEIPYIFDLASRILAEDEYEIVMLCQVSGYKRREVAEMLGIPIGTVTWKNNEALKKLRRHLEKEGSL